MSERSVSNWHRMDWRFWGQSESAEKGDSERQAWVCPYGNMQISGETSVLADQPRSSAQIREVSLGGLMLIVERSFESGLLLKVDVQCASRPQPHSLIARVIQSTQEPDGKWLVHCCFAREMSDEELRSFGAERVRPGTQDGRAWVRFNCEGETQFFPVVAASHDDAKAKIFNISAGGIGLVSDNKLDRGTLLSLELMGATKSAARRTQARVVHVTDRSDGKFLLGCTFVRELTDADLEALYA